MLTRQMANKNNEIECAICEEPIEGHIFVREDTYLCEVCLAYYARFRERNPDLEHSDWFRLTKGKVRKGKRGIPGGRRYWSNRK